MDDQVLSDLLAQYDATQSGAGLSLSFVRLVLKELRKSKLVRPDIVLKWGPKCLPGESNIDVWNLHEQICIAAIDAGEHKLAADTVELLKKQFAESNRVARLSGMLLEAQGKFPEALEVYEEILKKDIANLAARKRKVCIFKAQGAVARVVEELNEVLKFFPADAGCWAELSEVYVARCDYAAAAHCLEELVLLDPRNAHYHCRLAEALYSQDTPDSLLAARRHYAMSLNFQNAALNLRALYGLVACCRALKTSPRKALAADHEAKVSEELLLWANQQLETIAGEGKTSASIALVQSCLA